MKRKAGQLAEMEKPENSELLTGKNYFTRHWQGECSLPRSYWLNFVTAGALVLYLLTIYPEELITSTLHDFYIYITVYCITFIIISWQAVGVWRAADNHCRKTKSRFWANSAKFFVVLFLFAAGLLAKEFLPGLQKFSSSSFAGNVSVDNYVIRVMPNGKEVEITGGIRFGLTKELGKTFARYPKIRVVHLNSYGGRVVEARRLREFIEARNLDTSTNRGCFSACTIAFMGGAERFVFGEKKLGFHRYGTAGDQEGFMRNVVAESFNEDETVFIQKGVSGSFMHHIYDTSPANLWFPRNDVLLANHIVTDIVEDRRFLLYREKAPGLVDRDGKVLSAPPLYPAKGNDSPPMRTSI